MAENRLRCSNEGSTSRFATRAITAVLAALLALLAAGCDEFVSYRMWDGVPKLEPAEVEVRPGGSTTFAAQGGKPPYLFSIASGGGSIGVNGTRVEYRAPETPGRTVVRVTDGLGSQAEARVDIVDPPLVITPAEVTVRIRETVTFQAEGGYPPYAFSLVGSGGFGSSINAADGVYRAPYYPTVEKVRVTDSRGQTREATVDVRFPWGTVPLVPFGR